MELFNDTAAASGQTATPAQRAAYLSAVQPGIHAALGGGEP